MPNLPHARQEQEDQEAGGRHHRCACHPADGLGKVICGMRTRRATDTDTEEVGNRHGSAANLRIE